MASEIGSGGSPPTIERSGVSVPLIRVSSLAPVLRELDRLGSQADPLLARHWLARGRIADPYHEIPLARYVAFLEDAAAVARDEHLCAGIGVGFRPADLGPVGLLVGASSTLRRGLERLARSLGAWQDGTSIRLRDEDDLLVWSYRLDDPAIWPRRQDAEYSLTATMALARAAFGASNRPVEVHIEHAAPVDPAPLARLFGVRPLFGQPANQLVFERAEADRVHRDEDRDLMAILSRHVDDLCHPAAGDEGLIGKVRALVGLHLGHRQITLPVLASELNVSTRTLQRRLGENGTSLRALVQQCRMELGRAYLRDGRSSNAEIARSLGYSDSTAFWRAFKGQTGSAPSHFRRGK